MKSQARQVVVLICLAVVAGARVTVGSASAQKSPLPVPTDADLFSRHIFQEPLVPIGEKTTPTENAALSEAIDSYAKRMDRDDDSGIINFLKQYPKSPWRAALLLNLGLEYRQTGWFLKALGAWERSWELGKDATEPRAKALADRTVGELAELNARLGRQACLNALLEQIRHRKLIGSASEKIDSAWESSWLMQKEPEKAFTCGPSALGGIYAFENPNAPYPDKLFDVRSTKRGMSLMQVSKLAQTLKLDYVVARRQQGAKVIVPSVLSWRAEHYAALLKEENGRFLVQDPSLGGNIWVTQAVLDAETTGYFLVQQSKLPEGWRLASAKEASHVWGRGLTATHDETGTKINDAKAKPDGCSNGMAVYNFHLQMVSLNITDTPVGYVPPRGPAIRFTATYNQREANQPANFDYSNLGPKWTFNWLSYIEEHSDPSEVTLYVAGGGTESYTNYDSATHRFAPEFQSGAILRRVSTNPIQYERILSDGSRELFAKSDSTGANRRIFLTRRIDSADNFAELIYHDDNTLRIMEIRDALGKSTTFSYDPDDIYKIIKVTDPFNPLEPRFASFAYTEGQLTSITDTIGIVSQFAYDDPASPDFITTLTTPYASTGFARTDYSTVTDPGERRAIEATDVATGDRERVEYRHDDLTGTATGIPSHADDAPPDVPQVEPNQLHNYRNSFYWDRKAMAAPLVNGHLDYKIARLTQWQHHQFGSTAVSNIKERTKEPLENAVYYFYPQVDPNQPNAPYFLGTSGLPNMIAQKLTDTTSSIVHLERNSLGRVTQQIDPVGRQFSYSYWIYNDSDLNDPINFVDVKEMRQTRSGNELLFSATFGPQHRPLVITDAAGQTTSYAYNSFGQVLTVTKVENAISETTTYEYGDGSPGKPVGYLTAVISPEINGSSAETGFTYDDNTHQLDAITYPDNYPVLTDYDAMDRLTQLTFPDGTTEQFLYTDSVRGMTLDLTASKDRLDRWTFRHYNANRQMDTITEPGAPVPRTTNYDWCSCGSLNSIQDPNGNLTIFNRDVQGRAHQKVFTGDMSAINYLYDGQTGGPNTAGATSRLMSSTDALGRRTNYSYLKDGNVDQVSYTNASGAPLTPHTPSVSYTYDPRYNRLTAMEDGTGHTDFQYYEILAPPSLGAGQLEYVDGPLDNDRITFEYDELGRVHSQSINGTAQTFTYDPLGRLTTTYNALGRFGRTYDGVTPRLAALAYPNGVTASYSYFPNNADDRRLKTLANLSVTETFPLSKFDYTYKADGEIKSWIRELGEKTSERWFDYDPAQQLLSARNQFDANSATQILGYVYDPAGNRTADSNFDPQGRAGNGTFHTYTPNDLNQVDSFSTRVGTVTYPAVDLTYDLAGNLVNDGQGKTFEWDAANRLSAINYAGSQRTEFAYDGLGRRVKITEYGPGVTATIQPSGTDYTQYVASPFAFPSGQYSLIFEGLNNDGDNMVLIDSVALGHPLVANGSFENPDVSSEPGGYQYNPTDPTWTFVGDAGLASNGSDLTLGNPNAPDGSQVAFVQNAGYMFQIRNVAAGTYALHFQAAQREGNTMNQEVRVNLRPSGAGISVKRFVWCGSEICEERDSSGATVTKRFFAEGEQRIGGSDAGNYYYSRDHLGSVREVTDASGALKARYDYDPYGKSVVVDGNMSVDFGYTGHYFHAPSGLNLTLYRAYNPALGRWLSRDPIGEDGGINLYGYVGNSPVTNIDPLGLYIVAPLGAKGQYRDAMRYLMAVPEMRDMLRTVLASEEGFDLDINCKNLNGVDRKNKNLVHWDPSTAHEYANYEVQTPALVFGHELAHLAGRLTGDQLPHNYLTDRIPLFGTPEERRVITGVETAVARFYGEHVRHDNYASPKTHTVSSPSSQW